MYDYLDYLDEEVGSLQSLSHICQPPLNEGVAMCTYTVAHRVTSFCWAYLRLGVPTPFQNSPRSYYEVMPTTLGCATQTQSGDTRTSVSVSH